MRALLIAAVLGVTAVTFYAAAKLVGPNLGVIPSAQLSEAQSSMAAELAELRQAEAARLDEISMLNQSIQSMTTQRDNLNAALAQTSADLQATTTELTAQVALTSNNSSQVSDLETQLAARDTRLEEADATIQTLNEAIAANSVELDAMLEQIASLQTEAGNAAARAVLESGQDGAPAVPVAQDEQVSRLQTQIAESETTIEELNARITELTTGLETNGEAAGELTTQVADFAAEIEPLTTGITERDTLIASLETQLAEGVATDGDTGAQIADLTALVAERDATIATLEAAQVDVSAAATETENANAEIEGLTATLAERDATIAALEAAQAEVAESDASEELATVTSEFEAQVGALETRVAALDELVATQNTTIESLRFALVEAPETPEELASLCISRATSILDEAQINFATGTTSINEGSVTTLERLRDLAIGCRSDDLIIEIGGHTDSQGAQSANQELSETRAQAVLDFMVDRGIQSDSMRAVGFGEAQPIETNDTAAGRAANRRITFEWKLRETPDVTDEATSEAADDTVNE